MAKFSAQKSENILWITGHVDRSMESELTTALEEYIAATPENQVVDMSGVPYFASSAAKVLIGVAQDVQGKGGKLKVRSSKPVAQTLNLLGAKSWLEIEACTQANTAPSEVKPKPKPKPPASPQAPRIHDGKISEYRPRVSRPSPAGRGGSAVAKPGAPAGSSVVKPAGASAQRPGSSGVKPSASGIRPGTPPQSGAPSSGVLGGRRPVGVGRGSGDEDDTVMQAAMQREGQLLIPEEERPVEGPPILNEMVVLASYTFHFVGQEQELTVKALKHLGGAWILTDYKGTRRIVNLDQVSYIDLLT